MENEADANKKAKIEEINALSEQIKKDPENAKLYNKRAECWKKIGNYNNTFIAVW